MSNIQLSHIETEQDCLASFEVMHALRPHLADGAAYWQQVSRQSLQGYRLLAAREQGRVTGLAGYRIAENLVYGRFLYVDDLVTSESSRGSGVGAQLIEAVRTIAKEQGCAHLILDTALANALAQRFYFRQGLLARGMHFCEKL